jgi:hypothetical protein
LTKYFGRNHRDKKPFNWEEEFPEVFKQGGFNVIIGNPPYIFARGGNFNEDEKKYYYDKYKLQKYQINTYLLFIERGYNLLKISGILGFIVPNNWLTINSFSNFREFLLKKTGDLFVVNSTDKIFNQASVDNCILIFRKASPTSVNIGELKGGEFKWLEKRDPEQFYKNNFLISARGNSKSDDPILGKINKNSTQLNKIAVVRGGLKAYEVGKGTPPQTKEMKDERVYHSKENVNGEYLKYLEGVDVARYKLGWSGEYIKYGPNLAAPRPANLFQGKRILVRQIPSKPPYCINAVFTDQEYINDLNSDNVIVNDKGFNILYVTGLINSKLTSYWFIKTFNKFQRKVFPQFKVNELAQFPVYSASEERQQQIIKLVGQILDLNKDITKIESNSEKWKSIKSEIEKTDKKIDEEVYKLYGFTKKEIEIVEKN